MKRIDRKKQELREAIDRFNYSTHSDFELVKQGSSFSYAIFSKSKSTSLTGIFTGEDEEEVIDRLVLYVEGCQAAINYIMFNDLVSVEKTTYLADFEIQHKYRLFEKSPKFKTKVVDNRTKEYKRLEKKRIKEERRNKNGT